MTCNLCPRSRSNSQTKGAGIQFSVQACYHSNSSVNKHNELMDDSNYEMQTKFSDTSSHTSRMSAMYYPKLCPRHRVPSVCSSEATSHYRDRRSRRTTSNASDLASSVDINEFKSKSSRFYTRKNNSSGVLKNFQEGSRSSSGGNKHARGSTKTNASAPSIPWNYRRYLSVGDKSHQEDEDKQTLFTVNQHDVANPDSTANALKLKNPKETSNRVHFHLNAKALTSTDEEDEASAENTLEKRDNQSSHAPNMSIREVANESNFSNESTKNEESPQPTSAMPVNTKNATNEKTYKSSKSIDKNGLEWDNDAYWDNLELNAVGQINK